ncbi:uncharacterized protein BX664DRAFT_3273 [Halteromyces radiatus]|uniref:uncharacterized protein n=1 Tax=Halteromyces radiatus TaxID=101107 RepID=UPI002220267E|nr:uncharacterized protein BX664DRAFT_3273 [Halteromyces radiatus]KAI8098603.1 hypothetical protein BX664DRAFT_3273 [Halteromyces radiatus]
MSSLQQFANNVASAYQTQNSLAFEQLFTLDPNASNITLLQQALSMYQDETAFEQDIEAILEDSSVALANFTNKYLHLIYYIQDNDLLLVFDLFENFYSALIPVFNGSDSAFQVPLVKNLSSALVDSAFLVDKTLQLRGKSQKANVAARLLSKIFNIMLADRSGVETNSISKRAGIFHITNLAFKVYFKLNTVRMCQTFIANLQTGGVELNQYPISQQVTYQYYLGRYSLFQNRLRLAEKYLLFAFEKCTSHHWHNKRLILKYLVPTRLLLGKSAKPQLLIKYNLLEPYGLLILTLKRGDYYGFQQHLEKYFDYFYGTFTYVLLRERGKVLLWRCLLKKAYHYLCIIDEKTGNTMPLQKCLEALQFAMHNKDLDLADAESIVVSLVSQGYIKGYIHHQMKVLVLSKVNPFPRLADVLIYTEVYDEMAEKKHQALKEQATTNGMFD